MLVIERVIKVTDEISLEDEAAVIRVIEAIQSELPARLRAEHIPQLQLAMVVDAGLTDELNLLIQLIKESGVVTVSRGKV